MYEVTLAVDTSIYAAGDLISNPILIPGTSLSKPLLLQSIVLNDRAGQSAAMSFFLSLANTSHGTINSAPSASVSVIENDFAWFSIATGDYIDLGDASIAVKTGLGIICPPGPLYIGAINGAGTPTYAASTNLRLRLGLLPL